MITINNWIYTTRGWKTAEEVYVGDKIISFNPTRNCCEYDRIEAVEIKWLNTGGMGMQKLGAYCLISPDHPVILINKDRSTERKKIKDVFTTNKTLLFNKWFEPYHRSLDEEDIRYSARILAGYRMHCNPRIDFSWIKNIVSGLGGIEARWWLESFFQWGVLVNNVNYTKNAKIASGEIREIALIAAAKAGVGTDFHKGWNSNTKKCNECF